jgi:hypothetical protein
MTDFLGRLAGRTLGLAPTVQPRIASMYAQGQQFVGAGDAQEGIQDAWGAVTRAPTTGYQRREMTLPDVLPDEPPPGNLVGQTMHVPEMLLPLVPQENQPSITQSHGERPGVEPVPVRPTSLVGDAAEPLPGQVSMFRPESPKGNMPVRECVFPTVNPAVIAALSREQEHDLGQQSKGRVEVLESHQGPPSHLVGPINRGATINRATTASLPSSQPAIGIFSLQNVSGREARGVGMGPLSPPLRNQEVAQSTQESSAPVPTIQVTIGRIEVRATPPPAPHSQPKRSGPPVMGLEEYLSQRAKGGY